MRQWKLRNKNRNAPIVEPGMYCDFAVNWSSDTRELSTKLTACAKTKVETSRSRSNALASSTCEDAVDPAPLWTAVPSVEEIAAGMSRVGGYEDGSRARGLRGRWARLEPAGWGRVHTG